MSNNKKQTKVVVSGYIGFDNFGDECIFSILCDNLKEQNAEITAISSNPEKTKKIYNVKTCKTFNLFGIINALLDCDILISGGGSLLQDKTSLKSLLYYLFIIFCAKLFGKKVVIYAQGIGPLNHNISKILTKIAMKNANLITVRDEKSLFLLRGWGIKACLQPDPVFNLKLPAYSPQRKVGVQLRQWKYLSEDFINTLAENICANFSEYEILIFSFQDTLDLNICSKFEQILKNKNPYIKTKIITNSTTLLGITEELKTLEYLIAMRFHACLTALKFGIKTLAINYDEKVEKLAKEANIPLINLNKEYELEEKIKDLKLLKTSTLYEYANSKIYNFDEINNLINSTNNC